MCTRALSLLLALGAAAAVALAASAAPSQERDITLAVSYSFVGQYTNTQQLDASSCGVRLTETGDYRGWQEFRGLTLALRGGRARARERLRLLIGQWTIRGPAFPDNDCSTRPRSLDCTGAVRFGAAGPHRGTVTAVAHGNEVIFAIRTGFTDIHESDTYALDPTIGRSSPAACLAPLTPYLGLGDATASIMRVTATTTPTKLAGLRPGEKLALRVHPAAPVPPAVVAGCNAHAGCRGQQRQDERLTIVRRG